MKKLLDSDKSQILSRFANGEAAEAICIDYRVTAATIYRVASAGGVKRTCFSRRARSMQDTVLRLWNDGLTLCAISEMLSLSPGTVQRLVRNKTSFRSVTRVACRHDAFNEITEESAYWAGFLMADGCVHRSSRSKTGQPRIGIVLQARDEGHIVKFLSFLKCNSKITASTKIMPSGTIAHLRHVRITSQALADSLETYGVRERKTYSAVAGPKIEFNRHFWRGMVDGDGCIMSTAMNRGKVTRCPVIGLVGTPTIVRQFRNFILRVVTGGVVRIAKCAHSRVISQLNVSGDTARILARVLYQDAIVSLDRKRGRALQILSQPMADDHAMLNRRLPVLIAGKKRCGFCGQYKPQDCFSCSARSPHKLSYRCKSCRRAGGVRREENT